MNLATAKEYQAFLDAGYEDKSTPKQKKDGTFWFVNRKKKLECGIYANGYLRYINLNNPSAVNCFSGQRNLNMIKKLEPLATIPDYRSAMAQLLAFMQKHEIRSAKMKAGIQAGRIRLLESVVEKLKTGDVTEDKWFLVRDHLRSIEKLFERSGGQNDRARKTGARQLSDRQAPIEGRHGGMVS